MEYKPVQERVPDLTAAYMCLCALVKDHKFKSDDETFFREDVKRSLELIRKAIFK